MADDLSATAKTLTGEAPGRVEILGNHTDYNGGLVLAAAIDRAVRVRGHRRSDSVIALRSAAYGIIEVALDEIRPQRGSAAWANYPLGVARELLAFGMPLAGFAAAIDSDVPAGIGLGSSGAVGVAMALFILNLHERELPPLELATVCQRAEHRFAGVQSGLLDQVASLFGRKDHLVVFDSRSEEIRAVPFPREFSIIVVDSGARRELASGEYNQRREQTAAAAKALGVTALRDVNSTQLEHARDLSPLLARRARHIVEENERVSRAVELLRDGNAAALGELMNASHESSRTNFENSTRALDELVDLARKQPGVLGARLTGAGFGGAIIALCEETAAAHVARELAEHAASAFVCRPADGALARN